MQLYCFYLAVNEVNRLIFFLQREKLPRPTNEDVEDRDDDAPAVVVLNPGDLTEEEAAKYKKTKQEGE